MRITSKGQVTIPQDIREKHGLLPNTEVDFVVERGRVFLKHLAAAGFLYRRARRGRRSHAADADARRYRHYFARLRIVAP